MKVKLESHLLILTLKVYRFLHKQITRWFMDDNYHRGLLKDECQSQLRSDMKSLHLFSFRFILTVLSAAALQLGTCAGKLRIINVGQNIRDIQTATEQR